jgi:hypothetical protein
MRVNIRTQVFFVPERPDDGSQAIYCLERVQREFRPVGYGMNGWREGATVSDGGQSVAPQNTPFPPGRIMFAFYQPRKTFGAGYPRFVPPGQRLVSLC